MMARFSAWLMPKEDRRLVRLRVALAILAVFLGFLQTWHSRFSITNDTVPYLDMGDEYFRGEWSGALSGIWGPLYALVLGTALFIFKPSPMSEYTIVHLVVFAAYVLALFGLDFLYREWTASRSKPSEGETTAPWEPVLLAYALFIWTSLDVIGLHHTGPEMLGAALLYFAAGFLFRVRRGDQEILSSSCMGALLALGYLTKPHWLFAALAFIAAACIQPSRPRLRWQRGAYALVTFAILAAPNVAALSAKKGRLTLGDWSWYGYAAYVNDVPAKHWRGEEPETGVALHPTRRIVEQPATFEYGTPLPGTYPVWYDASYWYEGVRVRFLPQKFVRALASNGRLIVRGGLLGMSGLLLVSVLFRAYRRRRARLDDDADWTLGAVAVFGCAMYGVGDLEPRYLAPFVLLFWLAALSGVREAPSASDALLTKGIAVAVFVMSLVPLGPGRSPRCLSTMLEIVRLRPPEPNPAWEIADGMQRLGIGPGDKVASIDYPNMSHVFWARLARVRLVAEVYYLKGVPETESNDYFEAPPEQQAKVLQAFAAAGARAVVSDRPPKEPSSGTWQEVGSTGTFVSLLGVDGNGTRAQRK